MYSNASWIIQVFVCKQRPPHPSIVVDVGPYNLYGLKLSIDEVEIIRNPIKSKSFHTLEIFVNQDFNIGVSIEAQPLETRILVSALRQGCDNHADMFIRYTNSL